MFRTGAPYVKTETESLNDLLEELKTVQLGESRERCGSEICSLTCTSRQVMKSFISDIKGFVLKNSG